VRLPLPGVTVWSTGEALQEMVSEGNQKVPPEYNEGSGYPAERLRQKILQSCDGSGGYRYRSIKKETAPKKGEGPRRQ